MNRRHFIAATGATALLYPVRGLAQTDDLTRLLAEVAADPSMVEDSWAYREPSVTRGVGHGTPSTRKLSQTALDMIIAFEVASPAAYEAKYRRPIWPKGQSGVTIGVGYDLRFANRAFIDRDWPMLPQADRSLLYTVAGLGGLAAKNALASVRSVVIPWEPARTQFMAFIPYPTKDTEKAYPNCSELPDDCFGALVSLIYNRGPAMSPNSVKRKEMYRIKQLMAARNFADIPAQIRSMKRIWQGDPNARGLLRRREAEALLFEKGLRSA
ncbi:hypothetical protein [Sphingomonas bacterium]|uniref:hypothetical protein n=1 Tax=Sphingomonas bacterium TaxID=1895847 RepID=UPI00260EF275|nr:hypothetical protein [Sphingomonas bacterium]